MIATGLCCPSRVAIISRDPFFYAGEILLTSLPDGRRVRVRSSGSDWDTIDRVYKGPVASLPTDLTQYLVGDTAWVTDSPTPSGAEYRVSLAGATKVWLPVVTAAASTYVYNGPLAGMPADLSTHALGDQAKVTDHPAKDGGSIWYVGTNTAGRIWRAYKSIIWLDYSGRVAEPVATLTPAALAAGQALSFGLPAFSFPVGVMQIGRVFEVDYAVRRSVGTTNDANLVAAFRLNGVILCVIPFNSANALANGEYRATFWVGDNNNVTSSLQPIVTTNGAPQNTVDQVVASLKIAPVVAEVAIVNGTAGAVSGTYHLSRLRVTQLN